MVYQYDVCINECARYISDIYDECVSFGKIKRFALIPWRERVGFMALLPPFSIAMATGDSGGAFFHQKYGRKNRDMTSLRR